MPYANIALYMMKNMLVVFVAYLLGSINSAIIISKILYKEDIRTHGSGNAGLTNMLRTYGTKAAVLTLFGDMLKTALAIGMAFVIGGDSGYLGGVCINPLCYYAGMYAVLGHVFPVFYKFKGGKGVLVTATMALILCPKVFAALLIIFIIVVLISRYVSLGSIIVAILFPLAVYVDVVLVSPNSSLLILIPALFLGIFVVWCHRSNIKRLKEGNEKKISIGGKKKKE